MKTLFKFVGPFVLGILVVTVIGASQGQVKAKYEYLVRDFDPSGFGQKNRDSKISNEINEQIKQGWELDSFHAIKRYVEIDMGVAVASDFSLQPEDLQNLSVVNIDHLFPGSTIGICTLQGKYLGPAVQNFISQLTEDLNGFQNAIWNQPVIQEAD